MYRRYGPYRASQAYDRDEQDNVDYFAFRAEWHRRIIERFRRPEDTTFLDAGCGNGLLTSLLIDMSFQVTAFDFSREALAQARKQAGADRVRWQRSSIPRFRSPDRFDIVRCAEALVAITDDRMHAKAVRVLADCVVPGGHLILEEHLIPEHDVPERPGRGERIRLRSLERYEALAADTHLRLLEHRHVPAGEHLHDLDLLVFEPTGEVGAPSIWRRVGARLLRR